MLLKQLSAQHPQLQQKDVDRFMRGVVDFSEAQRNGFTRAYADFLFSRLPAVEQTAESYERIRNHGSTLLKGCNFHFQQSVERIRKNSAFQVTNFPKFKDLVDSLRKEEDMDMFLQTVKTIQASYPKCSSWLRWWMRNDISRFGQHANAHSSNVL